MASDHWDENENLRFICQNGIGIERIDEIATKGINLNQTFSNTKTPLQIACENNELEVVVKLLSLGAKIDSKPISLLYSVLTHSRLKMLKILIEFKINLNVIILGEPVLIFSLKNSKRKITLFLIENGANLNVLGVGGLSPLYLAIEYNEPIIVEKLIQSGADMYEKIPYDWGFNKDQYFIHKVCGDGLVEILKILVKYGFDVNLTDESTVTPLFYAVNIVDADDIKLSMINILLEAGADPTIIFENGNSLIDFAAESGSVDITVKLLSAIWNIDIPSSPKRQRIE